ncbi:MAG TPA: hypothetical protein PLB04_05020 [Nitrospira sp.]|nr:hypothetical protein [Nitrospira sp.]
MPKYVTCDLYASRETLAEAVKYSSSLIETLPQEYKAAAYTVLHVTLNTAIREINRADITNLIPRDEDSRPSGFRISELTPEEAQQMLRDQISQAVALAFWLEKTSTIAAHPAVSALAEPLSIFTHIVGRALGLTADELFEEARPHVQRLKESFHG